MFSSLRCSHKGSRQRTKKLTKLVFIHNQPSNQFVEVENLPKSEHATSTISRVCTKKLVQTSQLSIDIARAAANSTSVEGSHTRRGFILLDRSAARGPTSNHIGSKADCQRPHLRTSARTARPTQRITLFLGVIPERMQTLTSASTIRK